MSQSSAKFPPSVASILETLSKRSNVQSTLILSREDGSVISATGFAPEVVKDGRPQETGSSASPTKEGPTAAEQVASAIFHFVSASNALSSKMEILSIQQARRLDITSLATEATAAASKQSVDNESDTHDKSGLNEVQLLRMRTKRQEIIIYPDTKFLCCVIHSVGKPGQTNAGSAG